MWLFLEAEDGQRLPSSSGSQLEDFRPVAIVLNDQPEGSRPRSFEHFFTLDQPTLSSLRDQDPVCRGLVPALGTTLLHRAVTQGNSLRTPARSNGQKGAQNGP